jgi:hypothetical protein
VNTLRCTPLRRLIALFLLSLGYVCAQTATEPNLGSRLSVDGSTSPATYTFSWWGKSGCTYLVSSSPDLMAWSYLPNFNPTGADAVLSVQFITDSKKYFFRVVQFSPNDEPAITVTAGLPDEWQRFYFGHLGISASANPAGDGMSNLYKYRMGLNPLKNESLNDRDGDGVTNNQDARPNDSAIGRLTVVITAPAMGSTVSAPIIDTTPISEIPPSRDSDGRGLSDVWQLTYTGHLGVDPTANPSGDGFNNLYKAKMGLNPLIN